MVMGLVGAGPATQEVGVVPATQPTTRPDMTARVAESSVVMKDVAYVEGGTAEQLMDVYRPRDVRAAPIVLFVHGGEWARGDKKDVSFKPKFLNENGIIFASMNYRLAPGHKHPAQVQDVASAVKFVREHALEWGGAPSKVVLMGHSAGCHLVTLVGLDKRWLNEVGLAPTDLGGVVAWSGGAYDLWEKVHAGGMYPAYIRQNFGEGERALRDASPMQHVTTEPKPPMLVCSAGGGNPASREVSERLAGLIERSGGKVKTMVLEGKSHVGANHEVGMDGDVTGPALVEWVRRMVR